MDEIIKLFAVFGVLSIIGIFVIICVSFFVKEEGDS